MRKSTPPGADVVVAAILGIVTIALQTYAYVSG